MPRRTSPTLKRVGAGSIAAGIVAAMALLIPSEGVRFHAYLDATKTPTICYGETEGVTLGQVSSKQECLNMLQDDVIYRVNIMQACTTVDVTPKVAAAMIDFAYNAGTDPYCRILAPLLNRGQVVAACEWLGSHYTTSKHVRLRGLVIRRGKERDLCLSGVR